MSFGMMKKKVLNVEENLEKGMMEVRRVGEKLGRDIE